MLKQLLKIIIIMNALVIFNIKLYAVVSDGTYDFTNFSANGKNFNHNDFILSGTIDGNSMQMRKSGSISYGNDDGQSVDDDICVYKISADGTNTSSFELTGISSNDFNTNSLNADVYLIGNKVGGGVVQSVNTISDGSSKQSYGTSELGLANFNAIQLTSFELRFKNLNTCADLDFNSFSIVNAIAPSSNTVPTISGTVASQVVNDNATITPFSGVVLSDSDGDNISMTITLDTNAKGVLTGAGLSGSGPYTISSASATSVQATIRSLIFNPTDNRVAPASTETTTFSLVVNDGIGDSSTNSITSVVSTSVNNTPTDISLSTTIVAQSGGVNASVGTISSTDEDTSDIVTYTLVSGTGDTNNVSFNINGTDLRANDSSALSAGTYNIRLQVNDGDATYQESFTITVTDDVTPTLSSISTSNITTTGVTLEGTSNENGTMYFVIATTSSAPTTNDILTNNVTNSVLWNYRTVIMNTEKEYLYSSLTINTTYYYYIMAKDAVNNNSTISSGSFTTASDSTAPIISSISIPNTSMKVGSVVTTTITVSSDSDDYTTGSGGITGIIGGFALGSLSKTNDTTYTATFAVANTGTDIPSGSNIPVSFTLNDSAGNTSNAYATAISQNADGIDANNPTVTILSDKTSLKVGESAQITFTLSEESSNFTKDDITVAGGTLSILVKNANVYTSTFTPSSNITTTGTIDILANKFTDTAGNDNILASQKIILIDTVIPTVSIISDKNSMILSQTATITFTLNKDSSDFTKDDVSVVGGSLSSFVQDSGNSKVYTATLTPDSTLTTSITLDIDASVFVDSLGNNNIVASQESITILPSVVTYSPAVNGNSEIYSDLVLEFSENIQKGTGNIVIKKTIDDSVIETIDVLNSAVSIENLPSSNVLKPTVTISRNVDFDLNVSYYLTIDATTFKDSQGNNYSGISDKTVWTFSTVNNHAPVITSNSGNLNATIVVNENQTALIDIEANDSDVGQVLTYSILGTDASLFDIDSSLGVITFKTAPNYEVKSSYSLIVKVTDNGDGLFSDTQNLSVNINNVNDDPVITIASSITTNEDTFKDLVFTYTDEDANTVTAIEKTAPLKGIISISGTTITYTPNADVNGNDSFVLTFSDSNGYSNDKKINVTINAINDNPQISTNLSDVIQSEDGKGLIIELSTTDIDTDISSSPVSYTASSSDTNIAKASIVGGKLVVVPVLNANGSVTISVTSTVNGISSTKTFVYTLEGVNNSPTISNISDISHDQSSSDITKTITFDIWDDVGVTSLTTSSSNTNFLLNSAISVFKLSETQAQLVYTISANNAGNTTITVSAKDTENREYKESFNISIKAVNDALCAENTRMALSFDSIKLNNINQNSVTTNLDLLNSFDTICNSNIIWTTSDNNVIDTSGNVTQGSEEKTVTVNATIKKGDFIASKSLLITVPKSTVTNSEVIAKLLFETIKETNLNKNQITSKLNLVDTILSKTITWTSNNESSISPYSGYVTRTSNDETVTLTATIGNESKNFVLKVSKLETTDTQIVSSDKDLLTITSLLDKNIDANNIKYNLIKPLPRTASNGSNIVWTSSNTSYITIDGDVIRDSLADKYVTLTATITKNTESNSKEFNFRVLQNKIDNTQTSTFKNAFDTSTGSQITTSENGSDIITKSTFANSLLSAIEKVVSEESIKNILEFADKVINVYLNTDGTSQSILQISDGSSSSIKVFKTGSTTNVDEFGNIEISNNISNGSIKLEVKENGSVQHEVFNASRGTTSRGISRLPDSNVQADINGNLETSVEAKQKGRLYKIVIFTDNTGKTTTKYAEIDLSTGDENISKNIVSSFTPYPAGSTATISNIEDNLYIITEVQLDGTLIIE